MRRCDLLPPASAVLAAFALVGASACERGSISTDTEDQEAVGIEEIQEETAQVMGEEVVVAGEIDDLRSSRAFVLESDGFLGIFDDEILILTRSPIQLSGGQKLSEDSDVRVRGKVQKLVVADVETELGWG